MTRRTPRPHRRLIDPATVPGAIAIGVASGLIVLGVDITLHETVLAPPPRAVVEAPHTVQAPTPDHGSHPSGTDELPHCLA
ncbi:hypothetical protein GCM10010441_61770 [Kitasatospora paracochleata]|uniref:hypothetical protein n=1 Tax=Kitasatospora paracochleata TaxID=58354 RepID=UPI0031E30B41